MNESIKSARFLLVDDEPANVAVLKSMLKQWGACHIVGTNLASEAEPLFGETAPDIVLLDLMMPEIDGFEVMRRILLRVDPEDYLPILVLTADSNAAVKRRALEAGASDFLTKPFDASELSLRIQHLLQRRFLHRRLRQHNFVLDETVQQRTQQLAMAERQTVECLALAAEYRDDDTGNHAQRVGRSAALVAEAMSLDAQEVEIIRAAAPLHDVGKIGIADSVLLKPARLTPEEFTLMQSHATIGHDIMVRHQTPLLQKAASIALSHHERWNGRGYPQGLQGEAIPLDGHLVSIADVFDALTHHRPYKPAWSLDDALGEITRQRGEQFAPAVVDAFLSLDHAALLRE